MRIGEGANPKEPLDAILKTRSAGFSFCFNPLPIFALRLAMGLADGEDEGLESIKEGGGVDCEE